MDARHLILKGRVQGVGFRYFVTRQAQRLGVDGWVRNLENGDVEIRVEGEPDALDQLAAKVRKGPSMARVSEVEERTVEVEGYSGFSVRR